MKTLRLASFAAVILAVPASDSTAYTISAFAPGAWSSTEATMKANLGLTGFTFEDFDDATLIPGLTVSGHDTMPDTSTTSIAWTSDTGVLDLSDTDAIVFTLSPERTLFGVGIGGMTATDWSITVNGVQLVANALSLAGFASDGGGRNGYLIIQPDGGDGPISTVSFSSSESGPQDAVVWDHLTFAASSSVVPEPSTFALGLIGLWSLGAMTRRRNC